MRVLNGKLAAPDNDRCNPSESWSFLLVSSQSTQAGTGHPSKPFSTRVLVVTCSADEGRSGTCFGFFGPHQGSRITCPQKIWSAVDECPKRSVQCGKVTGQQTYLGVLDAGNSRCKSTWLIRKSRKPPAVWISAARASLGYGFNCSGCGQATDYCIWRKV